MNGVEAVTQAFVEYGIPERGGQVGVLLAPQILL